MKKWAYRSQRVKCRRCSPLTFPGRSVFWTINPQFMCFNAINSCSTVSNYQLGMKLSRYSLYLGMFSIYCYVYHISGLRWYICGRTASILIISDQKHETNLKVWDRLMVLDKKLPPPLSPFSAHLKGGWFASSAHICREKSEGCG